MWIGISDSTAACGGHRTASAKGAQASFRPAFPALAGACCCRQLVRDGATSRSERAGKGRYSNPSPPSARVAMSQPRKLAVSATAEVSAWAGGQHPKGCKNSWLPLQG